MYIKIFQKTNLQFMPENEKQESEIYKVVMNLRQKKYKIDMNKERVYIERCCYYC